MAANMWENSLKNVESDNNKILYETVLDFFLQRNGTYFLNQPRTLGICLSCQQSGKLYKIDRQFREVGELQIVTA